MKTLHLHWNHNTDACKVLANAFDFGNSVEDRMTAWAALFQDLGGPVRPYMAAAKGKFGVGKKVTDRLFPARTKYRLRMDHANRRLTIDKHGGMAIDVRIQDEYVQVDVSLRRNSTVRATELAFKLGALPIVLACAATELADGPLRDQQVQISYPDSLRLCPICSTPLWNSAESTSPA